MLLPWCCLAIDFLVCLFFFFFKQKTAYEMRISDWSSDVCSSDLHPLHRLDRREVGAELDEAPGQLAGAGREVEDPRVGADAHVVAQDGERFVRIAGAKIGRAHV